MIIINITAAMLAVKITVICVFAGLLISTVLLDPHFCLGPVELCRAQSFVHELVTAQKRML